MQLSENTAGPCNRAVFTQRGRNRGRGRKERREEGKEGGGRTRGRMAGRKSGQEPGGWEVNRRGDQEGSPRGSLRVLSSGVLWPGSSWWAPRRDGPAGDVERGLWPCWVWGSCEQEPLAQEPREQEPLEQEPH